MFLIYHQLSPRAAAIGSTNALQQRCSEFEFQQGVILHSFYCLPVHWFSQLPTPV